MPENLSNPKLKLLDLFSGIRIGGFSLGLERTGGFETVAFCEIEPFPRKILNKHWPEVPCYDDVRTLTAESLERDGIGVDAICGGFPCQDISTAGKGAGIEGERSGLWSEYARLIGKLRPQVVFVENVAALLGRGLDKVLGDLASLGYDAEWHCISASAIGAHHHRDRLWIVAYANNGMRQPSKIERPGICAEDFSEGANANAGGAGHGSAVLANSEYVERSKPLQDGCGFELGGKEPGERRQGASETTGRGGILANPLRERSSRQGRTTHAGHPTQEIYREVNRAINDRRWKAEPAVGRVANGISDGMDRLKALGNAVVPQIPEILGNAYLESIGWGRA